MYENNPITYLEVHILAVIWCMKTIKIIAYIYCSMQVRGISGALAVELTKYCNKTSIFICNRNTSSTNIEGILPKGLISHAWAWRVGRFWRDILDIIILLRTTTSRRCIFEGTKWLSDYHGCMTYPFVELWMCICMSIKYLLHLL